MSAQYGASPYAGGAGNSSSGGGYNSYNNTTDSPLNKVREYTSKVEDVIDQYTQPIKPHLPALGRFLIVVTFLEDALRIMTQWSDQKYYLQKHRHFPWGISHIFLFTNVVVSAAKKLFLLIYGPFSPIASPNLFSSLVLFYF